MAGGPIGELIDGLGVVASLKDGELVSSAVVLMAVVGPDGSENLRLAWSEGQSWITRRGMLETALDTERIAPSDDTD